MKEKKFWKELKRQKSKIFLAESEEACEQAYNDMIEVAKGMGLEQLEAYATETYHNAKGE